jgi:hypothetical protein
MFARIMTCQQQRRATWSCSAGPESWWGGEGGKFEGPRIKIKLNAKENGEEDNHFVKYKKISKSCKYKICFLFLFYIFQFD